MLQRLGGHALDGGAAGKAQFGHVVGIGLAQRCEHAARRLHVHGRVVARGPQNRIEIEEPRRVSEPAEHVRRVAAVDARSETPRDDGEHIVFRLPGGGEHDARDAGLDETAEAVFEDGAARRPPRAPCPAAVTSCSVPGE